MEDCRFDSLTRSLAQRPTRRVVARVFGALTLGGILAPLLAQGETPAKHKKKHKKKRGGTVPPPPVSPPPVPPPPPPPPPNICAQRCTGANCTKCLIRVNDQPPVCASDFYTDCGYCTSDSDCSVPPVCVNGIMDRATGTVANPCAERGAPTFCAGFTSCT